MMKTLIVISLAVLAGALAEAKSCESPSLKTVQYITQDATVLTRVAFLVQFQVTCKNDAQYKPTLYAEVEGKSMPAIKLNNWDRKDNLFENYQISWTEETKKVRSGVINVKVYDEESYAAIRKAHRNGEDASHIEPLLVIPVQNDGIFTGPWINSEFLATVLAGAIYYFAYTAKSKLLA